MNVRTIGTAVVAACLGLATGASAQCGHGWSDAFKPGTFDRPIDAAAIFDDGSGPRLVVAGRFERVGDETIHGLASWNGDGWQAMELPGGEVPSVVRADPGGGADRLYAWSSAEEQTVYVFESGRWSALPPMGTRSAEVTSVLAPGEGDGERLFLSGSFVGNDGLFAPAILWDGQAWRAMNVNDRGGRLQQGTSMVWIDDADGGSLYVGGSFWADLAEPIYNLARWSGGEWHSLGWDEHTQVERVETLDRGGGVELFVLHRNGVSRLADGQWTHAVEYSMSFGPPSAVTEIDGEPEVVWTGTGRPEGPVSLWRWNGGELTPFGGPLDSNVHALVADSRDRFGGGVLALGGLQWADEARVSNIAQLRQGRWQVFEGVRPSRGAQGAKSVLFVDRGRDGVLGGRAYVGVTRGFSDEFWTGCVTWDGERWVSIAPEPPNGFAPDVFAYGDLGSGGRVFAGGAFVFQSHGTLRNIAAWDGVSWRRAGDFPNRPVRALLVSEALGTPLLFAAGEFTSVGSLPAGFIAAYDGVSWRALGSGLDGIVNTIVVHDDGTGPALYAGGAFTRAGGAPAAGVARWDGGEWSPVGDGLDRQYLASEVTSMAVAEVGGVERLYAGGNFQRSGPTPLRSAAVWDGQSWRPMGDGLFGKSVTMSPLETADGTVLLAGGGFSLDNGEPGPGLAAWDGTSWTPFDGGTVGPVSSISTAGRGLFLAGNIVRAGGVYTDGIAAWGCVPTDCLADYTADGVVDSRDIVAFLRDWAAGDGDADIDGDGDVDTDDVTAFLSIWNAGC